MQAEEGFEESAHLGTRHFAMLRGAAREAHHVRRYAKKGGRDEERVTYSSNVACPLFAHRNPAMMGLTWRALIGSKGVLAVEYRHFSWRKWCMQTVVWIIRLFIVLVLVWFAVKNAQVVTIHGLPEQSWQAPLVFILLVVFVAGVLIGLLAWVPTVVRQRREIGRLKRSAPQQPAPSLPIPASEPPHGI
jgi:lipopolysaccharide assembly protein A